MGAVVKGRLGLRGNALLTCCMFAVGGVLVLSLAQYYNLHSPTSSWRPQPGALWRLHWSGQQLTAPQTFVGGRGALRPDSAPQAGPGPRFVIGLTTVHRPGNASYLTQTLLSLQCALKEQLVAAAAPSHNPAVQPVVAAAPNDTQQVATAANGTLQVEAAASTTLQQQQPPPPPPPQQQQQQQLGKQLEQQPQQEQLLPPPVFVANGDLPASRHTEFSLLQNNTQLSAEFRAHLRLLEVQVMHEELHHESFVTELVDRARKAVDRTKEESQASEQHPADRFFWQCKEVMDTAYVMEAAYQAAPGAQYYIHLQDDTKLAAGFLQKLDAFLTSKAAANSTVDVIALFTVHGSGSAPVQVAAGPWGTHFGFVGLAVRMTLLPVVIQDFRANYTTRPVDHLFNEVIVRRGMNFWVYYPSLVQHVGLQSSLQGKTQPARSASFVDTAC